MQYNTLKYGILSGGINHIDTGHQYRRHRAERVVGLVLRTLTEKFGLQRDEVFITSKQGFVGYNSIDNTKELLQVEELLQTTDLTADEFMDGCMYSIHPTFLDICLNNSL